MTDEEKEELIDEVISGFDFELARTMANTKRKKPCTIDEMKARARIFLLKALENQDREFWWIGGMHHGGLCACYDSTWGLSLNYIIVASRVKVIKNEKL